MGLNLDILSRNLKLLRTANGMSQEELADKIYLTRSTYSTYESGAKPPGRSRVALRYRLRKPHQLRLVQRPDRENIF